MPWWCMGSLTSTIYLIKLRHFVHGLFGNTGFFPLIFSKSWKRVFRAVTQSSFTWFPTNQANALWSLSWDH